MSDESEGCFIAAIVLAVVVYFCFYCPISWQNDTKYWREETVKRGVAEWVLDPVTGETYWKWKEL